MHLANDVWRLKSLFCLCCKQFHHHTTGKCTEKNLFIIFFGLRKFHTEYRISFRMEFILWINYLLINITGTIIKTNWKLVIKIGFFLLQITGHKENTLSKWPMCKRQRCKISRMQSMQMNSHRHQSHYCCDFCTKAQHRIRFRWKEHQMWKISKPHCRVSSIWLLHVLNCQYRRFARFVSGTKNQKDKKFLRNSFFFFFFGLGLWNEEVYSRWWSADCLGLLCKATKLRRTSYVGKQRSNQYDKWSIWFFAIR